MNKDKAQKILATTLDKWEKADKSTGYLYEKNFRELMAEMNSQLFSLSVGDVSQDRNTKKK